MKTVTYIVSNIDKALAFEWIAEKLDKKKYSLSFILLNPSTTYFEEYLISKNIPVKRIKYKSKKDFPIAIIKIFIHLIKTKPDIVHTHLFDASLSGLIASKIAGIKKRIYTRHHSNFHHEYFPEAVKYDKAMNYLSTDIIATSEVVKETLLYKEKVSPEKIHLIHHGFDLKLFSTINQKHLEELRNKYNINKTQFPVIGVISRYFNLKGIQYIIPAFKKIRNNYPNAHLILANATGTDKAMIQQLLETLPNGSYTEIRFESNLFALYHLFDIFVHAPINPTIEAFGQVYVEALAAGIPSIFTLSGVANEFIKNEENALVVNYNSSEQIYLSILRIIQDDPLKQKLITNGIKSAANFDLSNQISLLENLYIQE